MIALPHGSKSPPRVSHGRCPDCAEVPHLVIGSAFDPIRKAGVERLDQTPCCILDLGFGVHTVDGILPSAYL